MNLAYIRVSTDRQAREGLSMDAQRDAITRYAELYNLSPIDFLEDRGASGKSLKGRPGIAELLERVRNGRASSVIVYKVDRMFRSIKDALGVFDLLKTNRVAFHSVMERWDTSSAAGEAALNMVLVFAQMEARLAGERTSSAIRERKGSPGGSPILDHRKDGGTLMVGKAPYGFSWSEGTLIPQDDEIAVIRNIFKAREKNGTLRAIVNLLDVSGTKTRGGKLWNEKQIRRILAAKPTFQGLL